MYEPSDIEQRMNGAAEALITGGNMSTSVLMVRLWHFNMYHHAALIPDRVLLQFQIRDPE
jgi:hypothetical protein